MARWSIQGTDLLDLHNLRLHLKARLPNHTIIREPYLLFDRATDKMVGASFKELTFEDMNKYHNHQPLYPDIVVNKDNKPILVIELDGSIHDAKKIKGKFHNTPGQRRTANKAKIYAAANLKYIIINKSDCELLEQTPMEFLESELKRLGF